MAVRYSRSSHHPPPDDESAEETLRKSGGYISICWHVPSADAPCRRSTACRLGASFEQISAWLSNWPYAMLLHVHDRANIRASRQRPAIRSERHESGARNHVSHSLSSDCIVHPAWLVPCADVLRHGASPSARDNACGSPVSDTVPGAATSTPCPHAPRSPSHAHSARGVFRVTA